MPQPELESRRVGPAVGLPANILEREAGGPEHRVPVEVLQHRVDLGGVHPGGERAADQPAHAGAGRHVDRDAMLLEPLDDANMRDAAGAAAAEGYADRGAVLLRFD